MTICSAVGVCLCLSNFTKLERHRVHTVTTGYVEYARNYACASNNVFMTTNSFLEFPKYLCQSLGYTIMFEIHFLTGHLPSSKKHFRIPADSDISKNGRSTCCDACFVQLKKYFLILQYRY